MPSREQLEQIREDERHFYGDVEYEVWRSGGNPDLVDHDRIHDLIPDVDYAARRERLRQSPAPEPEEEDTP